VVESRPECELNGSIEISRRPEDVWTFLGDFEDVEAWASSITSSYRTTGPDIGVGSRRTVWYRWVLRLEEAITEWTDGQKLTYSVFGAPAPFRDFHETWSVAAAPGGATVTARVRYNLSFGFAGRLLNQVLLKHVLRFEVWAGLRALKRYVETRSPAPASLDDGASPAP
jgi:hypothetical protein